LHKLPRIACFHLNQIGDLLFSLPAIFNLRASYPEAHIVSVARPQCRELLTLSGLVDDFIPRPRRPLGPGLRITGLLRRQHIDTAMLFSRSIGMLTLALLSGARIRAGFAHPPVDRLLSVRVPWEPPPSTRNNLRLVEAIGCPVTKTDYVGLIKTSDAERNEAARLLRSVGAPEEGFAVIGPGTSTGREIKAWTDEGFAETADRLAEEHGLRSVVVGASGGGRIAVLSKNAADLTGRTSLPVLAALLEKARLFVGVDSGVMHLAAAMRVQVVALFGPTDPRVTGPEGEGHVVVHADLPCRPCLAKSCNAGRRCMLDISPRSVLDAVTSIAASVSS
jgi:ADP-heptose:LPS heptosyltransferase